MNNIHTCAGVVELEETKSLVTRVYNEQFLRMLGTVETNHDQGLIRLGLLPDTVAAPQLSEKLIRCFTAGRLQDSEQIYNYYKGEQHWRLTLALIWQSHDATSPSRIVVTGFEVPGQEEEAQQTSETHAARYEAIVNLAYDAIVTMDRQRRITLFNYAAESLFGYSAHDVIGQPIEILLPEHLRATHPQKVQEFSESYQPRLRRAAPPRMDETNTVFGRHSNGSLIPVEVAVSKIEMNGKTEFIAVVRDVSDRARLIELLRKEAMTDMLTGLANRRQFIDFLEKELRTDKSFSVFVLDVDFFKVINDEYGHDAGDEVLRVVANIGASILGAESLFARWGGEEFVAVLPGADADIAFRISSQIRQRYENQDFEYAWPQKPIPFTVSIGVATRCAEDGDVDGLMKRADRALYRAKQSGRNRVELG